MSKAIFAPFSMDCIRLLPLLVFQLAFCAVAEPTTEVRKVVIKEQDSLLSFQWLADQSQPALQYQQRRKNNHGLDGLGRNFQDFSGRSVFTGRWLTGFSDGLGIHLTNPSPE
jgi:hypothetical protein